jgi:pimeloyl-ACP methyl ester carboxylesterase
MKWQPLLLLGIGISTLLLVLALTLAGSQLLSRAPTADGSFDVEAKAQLVEDHCWFDTGWFGRRWFGSGWLKPTRCGWLYPSVLDAGGEAAALPVVVLRANRLGGPTSRATIYVSGGPGGNSYLDDTGIPHWRDWMARLGLDHDLVLFDQRGTGGAWPRLDCPQLLTLYQAQLDSSLDPDSLWAQYEQVLLSCSADIADADRASGLYSTATAASDLRELAGALRRTHGYRQVSVYGVSYGTRLAVEAVADVPGLIDAVVLDSLYPAGIDQIMSFADNFAAILSRMEATCAAAPDCSTQGTQLQRNLARALERVEKAPISLLTHAEWMDPPQQVRIDAPTLMALVEHVLFAQTHSRSLPERLAEAAEGRFGQAWQELLAEWVWSRLDPEFNSLTHTLIECRDNAPLQPEREAAMLARHPHWQAALRMPQASFHLCDRLGITAQPLQSRILTQATLVLAADLDPRTPADLALPSVADFPRLQSLRLPIAGHSVVDYDDCAAAAAGAFLNAGGNIRVGDCAPARSWH